MIEFEYLELNKRTHFKSQRFNLKKKGISLILGFNRKTKSSNGVGKSMFFGELPDLLTAGEATGTRQDRVRKGSIKLGVKKGKTRYEFEQIFSPSEKLIVRRNNEDMEFHSLKDAREKMLEVIPYSEQAVASFLYLDLANSVHPLIAGTTAMRKAFFRDFFKQMDSVGPLRKLIEQAHAEVEQAGRRASELQAEIESIGELRKIAPIRRKVQLLQAERDEFSDRLSEVTSATSTWRRLNDVCEVLGNTDDVVSLGEDPLGALKEARKAVRKRRSAWDEYSAWSAENVDLEKLLSDTESINWSFMERFKGVPADEALNSASEKLEEARAAIKEYERSVRALKRDIEEAEDSIEKKSKSLARAKEGQGKCPTCGGEYHDKHLEKRIQELRLELRSAKAELGALKDELDGKEVPSVDVDRLEKRFALAEKYAEASKELARLQRRAASRPDEPKDSEKSISREEARLDSLRERAELYSEYLSLEKTWKGYSKEIRSLAKSSDLHEAFVKKNDELVEAKLDLQTLEGDWERKTKLESEMADKQTAARRKKYLDILKQAFSPKGVEKELISMACSMLEEQVNKFAKLVFSEDFRFYFEMESTFAISVERHYGKRQVVSDVRKLSGAEKRLFSLVMVVSLLSFVPPAQRPNILILDEPTATMGEDNKSAFVRFLPVLNKVIPHLIIITPLMPHDFAHLNPDVYTVVRDGGLSYISEGVVDANSKLPNRT